MVINYRSMFQINNSLRTRIALTFSVFGALVSMVLAVSIYLASHNLESQLIEDTLVAELDDYIDRRARNPNSRPEHTATISAYVISQNTSTHKVPAEISRLQPGFHAVTLNEADYVAGVRRVAEQRFIVLYSISALQQRERGFVLLLLFCVFVMTTASAFAGRWLATRAIAPITELAQKITHQHPEHEPKPLADQFRLLEIHQMAQDFDLYFKRLHDFILRERLLTGDISHELRTPISVIQGSCELLMQAPENKDKVRHHTQRILRAATEMGEISAALLALAREQNNSSRSIDLCPVIDVIDEAVKRYQQLFRNKPVDLKFEVLSECEYRVDHAMLMMVAGNLIRNAMNFTAQGEVLVTLDKCRLSIEDNGPGIGERTPAELFNAYVRGAQSSGAGLGLSLVSRLCDQQGWSIKLSNRSGGGTSAILILQEAESIQKTV